MQCRHQQCHCLLPLDVCLIQLDQICTSSGTHHYYHHSDELSLYVVVGQVPTRVVYMPWSEMYSFLGASQVVIQDIL